MTQREAVLHEVGQLPDDLLPAVLVYVRELKNREQDEQRLSAIASQAVLAKDWLSPEEDEAWRDL